MKEVAQNYAVDAIVFDRMRYANLYNDYSDLTRATFEKWLGHPVNRWPGGRAGVQPAPRQPAEAGQALQTVAGVPAKVIRDFVGEATDAIRAVKPPCSSQRM